MPSSRIWGMASVCLVLLLTAAHAEAQCPYTSVQARVQLNVQDPWKQAMTLPQGTPFHVGAFKNAWGQFVDCCTSIQVTSPNGTISNVSNDSYVATPLAGTYTLRVSCGPYSESATVTATANSSCPYTSVQARVQRNLQDPWKTSMTVVQGETFHIGAMKNNSGQFVDCCNNTTLQVTAPNGAVSNPANDTYVSASQVGTYTVRATCGALSDTASVTVLPPGSTCPYGSIQARIQLHEQDAWRQSVSLIQGQRFRIGGFYDSTSNLAPSDRITLQVTGPNGYLLNPPVNGVYVDAPYAGTYSLRATCNNLTDWASVSAAPTTPGIPVQRPNINGIGVAWGTQWNLNPATTARTWDRNNLDKIAEAGSLTTHVSFDWVGIEPSNNVFNFSYTDHQVNEAEARGLLMLGYTGNTPNWALPASQANFGYRFPPQEQWAGEFESFFQTLAQRYCGRVRYYEFWNEPNGCSWIGDGCAGNSDDAAVQLYVLWLQRWYRAMKRGCPDTVLLTGGLDCHLGTNCRRWLDQVYRFGGREYFDGVAIHPYGDDQNPTQATALNFSAITEMSAELAENGQTWKKLWLDEWGYTTSNEGVKGQMIDYVLRELADNNRYPNVFEARYLTVSDLPMGNNTRGLAEENLTSYTLSPRLSWYSFQDRALGSGNEAPLVNKRMESLSTPQYGGITSWGPNGAWAYHRLYPRPNNQNLGQSFAYYSAGTTETVGQIVPGMVFQPGKTYTFKGWVHGGGDNTGVVPFQIGYAAVSGNLGSFQPLATVPVTVGNTWFESPGVSWISFTTGPELGKQIIVRLGNGASGGSTDIWFDNLKLIVSP